MEPCVIWNKMNNQSFLKRLSSIGIITVLIVYVIALTTEPATGYELNIFAMYSPIFWILFFSAIAISITILALSEYWKITGYWKRAFFSIILLYCIYPLLPLIRGYYLFARGSCDIFAHLSWAQLLLNTGTMTTYYPLSHILLADFHFAGLNLDIAAHLFPVLFTILLLLFLSILGRSLQNNSWVSLLPVLFSLPLLYGMFHRTFHPYIYALFFIPLFFYLLLKSFNHPEMKQYTVLLIIISFFIVFMHPLITLVLIAFTLAFYATNMYLTIHNPGKKNRNSRIVFFILSILAISFCVWYLSFRETLTSIRKVIFALLDRTESVETILEYQITLFTTSDAHPLYIAKLFLLNYGPIFCYLIFGLILCIFVLITTKKKKASDTQLIFSVQFLSGLLLAGIFIAGYFILFEPLRAVAPALLMATVFIPIALSGILSGLHSERTRKVIFSFFTVFLIIIVSVSLLTIFSSPIISTSSHHMTYMERDGLDWFLSNRDNTIPVVLFEYSLSYRKYEMYFYNNIYPLSRHTYIDYLKIIPTQFGYQKYQNLAETLDHKEYYYISTELDRQRYLAAPEERRERIPKITSSDFNRVKQDDSINLLYNNGEFESWWIPRSVSRLKVASMP